ncbi:P1 family peptidase [Nocardiopsis oceani]
MTATDPRLVPVPDWEPGPGNDDYDRLEPVRSTGAGAVEFDFPGVRVGTAEYAEGPTGATVVAIPEGARTSVDARGGAIGIVGRHLEFNHAVCVAGGSSYGLAAATGVQEELLLSTGNRVGWRDLRTVAGAVVYDLGARPNAVVPDAALGRAAFREARPDRIPVGRVGAGTSASAGKIAAARCEFAGQGAAFLRLGDIRVLVVTVVNPVGVVVDRGGTVVRGNYDTATGTRRHPQEDYARALAGETVPSSAAGNTTVTVAVTNVRLADKELRHFGRQVHSSMHRAIQPFHTDHDGDTLFALTTDEVDLPAAGAPPLGENSVSSLALATVTSEVAWDAVLSAVR